MCPADLAQLCIKSLVSLHVEGCAVQMQVLSNQFKPMFYILLSFTVNVISSFHSFVFLCAGNYGGEKHVQEVFPT